MFMTASDQVPRLNRDVIFFSYLAIPQNFKGLSRLADRLTAVRSAMNQFPPPKAERA